MKNNSVYKLQNTQTNFIFRFGKSNSKYIILLVFGLPVAFRKRKIMTKMTSTTEKSKRRLLDNLFLLAHWLKASALYSLRFFFVSVVVVVAFIIVMLWHVLNGNGRAETRVYLF